MPVTMLTPRSAPIAAGDDAPDFTLTDQARGDWTLSEHLSNGRVVLCFFPFAFTGVCSTEMKCISDEMDTWKTGGATVVGISCDSPAVLKEWAQKLGLKHTMLSDPHRLVCRAYGMYWAEKNVASRGTVIVGAGKGGGGRVEWVQAREPGSAMDVDEVLSHARSV